MGLAPGDFDDDGDIDLYIGCDVMPNLYLENVDRRGFKSVGAQRGGALNRDGRHESGMGVAAADLFNRGRLDLLTTNFAGETNTYYRNEEGYWEDRTLAVGFHLHAPELGWGVIAADFDQDGRRDVFIANGHIYPQVEQLNDPADTYEQPPRVFLGTERKLAELPPDKAFSSDADGDSGAHFSLRAVTAGDLDDDGDWDVVAVQHNGPLVIFENLSNRPAICTTLKTRSGGLSPHGTHLSLGDWHHIHFPTQGYQSSHDPRVLLPPGASGEIAVRWPDGSRERFTIPLKRISVEIAQDRSAPLKTP
jgi:hypothetical protein